MEAQTKIPIDLSNYPAYPDRIPSPWAQRGDYEVSFAQSREDLDEIFQLRYQVFNLEMNEGLEESHEFGRDFDAYDATCHHVVVRYKPTRSIIGTYRLQTREMAGPLGFYGASEFQFSMLPEDLLNDGIEVGRACIAKDHRNGRVLVMLWRGVIRYLVHNDCRYLFGCCSINSQDPLEAVAVRDWLKQNCYIRDDLFILPQPGYECDPEDGSNYPEQVTIPTLMRLYLQNDLLVLGDPAIDRTFKTIDYFVLLDTARISDRTRKLIFPDQAQS